MSLDTLQNLKLGSKNFKWIRARPMLMHTVFREVQFMAHTLVEIGNDFIFIYFIHS